MAKSKLSWRARTVRILRGIAIALVVLIAIPIALTPVYLVINPISVPMLERYLTNRPVIRHWQDIDAVSDRLKAAVILSEDGQFCRHWGVDMSALRDELDNFVHGRDSRGASTITMQVARNLFLTNARNPARKLLEVPLALYIDLVMSKRRIMEIYLNIAEWGPGGQFGIAAGTEAAFNAEPQSMAWGRSALMAVTLPNPLLRLPAHPSSGMLRLARVIADRAQQYGDRAGCVGTDGTLKL